jgi:hypothetical protein
VACDGGLDHTLGGLLGSRTFVEMTQGYPKLFILLLLSVQTVSLPHPEPCAPDVGAPVGGMGLCLRGGHARTWKLPSFNPCAFQHKNVLGSKNLGEHSSSFHDSKGAPTLDPSRRRGKLIGRGAPERDKLSEVHGNRFKFFLFPSQLFALFLSDVPKVARYTISCAIANVLYFWLYSLLLESIASAGVCVNIAYAASVVWQHALHRILVYGKGVELSVPYLKELMGIYMAYIVSFILNPMITEACIALGNVINAHTCTHTRIKQNHRLRQPPLRPHTLVGLRPQTLVAYGRIHE